ncbi:hypothetical protein FO519_007020 [Halicephalobus sp. NKZ332]|nr:hypothetical protein FO519_007020 [Halicephalobus sp. NKZ332]
MSGEKPILYSFYRSSCSWRVRIALELKGIDYEYRAVNLAKMESRTPEYKKINPRGLVPVLVFEGRSYSESMSIIEFLEEKFPNKNPLLPKNPEDKAIVRSLASEIFANIQPLQTPKSIDAFGKSLEEGNEKAKKFIEDGFEVLEEELKQTSGKYCFGDQITIADLFIPGQVYNAVERFGVDISKYPLINRINNILSQIPEFIRADAWHQPDTPVDQKK